MAQGLKGKSKFARLLCLAGDVLEELHVPENAEAAIVFKEAKEIGDRIKVAGLLSADQIFGFLERRYTVEDIRAAGRSLYRTENYTQP